MHRFDGIYNKRLQVAILIDDVLGHHSAETILATMWGPKFYSGFCGLKKYHHPCSKDDVQYPLPFTCPTRGFSEIERREFLEGWQG